MAPPNKKNPLDSLKDFVVNLGCNSKIINFLEKTLTLKEKITMTRSELIANVTASFQHLTYAQVEEMVVKIFDEIMEALAQGGRVELRGFGTFSIRHRKPRKGRNPRTGEILMVESKSVPFFKTGKELRQLLNS